MTKDIRFGILRSESRFSDLSPGIQSLFNQDSAKEILRKEAIEEQEIDDEVIEEILAEVLQEADIDIDKIIEEKAASIFSENENKGISEEQIKQVLTKCLSSLGPGKLVKKGQRIKIE